jgi:hypothetical protein
MNARRVFFRRSADNASVCGQPYWWFHYLVIEDERVTVIDMKQALLAGMNFGRVEVQSGEDWRGMTADEIIAWKRSPGVDDHYLTEAPEDEGARVLAWLDKREP